jgi:hypothetical protein
MTCADIFLERASKSGLGNIEKLITSLRIICGILRPGPVPGRSRQSCAGVCLLALSEAAKVFSTEARYGCPGRDAISFSCHCRRKSETQSSAISSVGPLPTGATTYSSATLLPFDHLSVETVSPARSDAPLRPAWLARPKAPTRCGTRQRPRCCARAFLSIGLPCAAAPGY